MMLKPITLPVYIDADEVSDLTGKPYPMKDHSTEEIDFYRIDAVSDYKDEANENKMYGCVHLGTIYYITIYSPKKLRRIIREHMTETMVMFTKN